MPMYDRQFTTLEEDQKRPMVFQTTEEARVAREARSKPKITVRRVEVTRGIMRAIVYPSTGSLLLETQSGTKMALDCEETRALQSLLNAQLGSEAMLPDEEKPDLDLGGNDE